MAIQLPNPPTQNAGETLADFYERHRAWHREWDLKLKVAQHDNAVAWGEAVGPNVAPTLERIADAWDALDARLGQVAVALGSVGKSRPTAADVFLMLADKFNFRPSDTDANWPKQIEPMVTQIMAALDRVDPPGPA